METFFKVLIGIIIVIILLFVFTFIIPIIPILFILMLLTFASFESRHYTSPPSQPAVATMQQATVAVSANPVPISPNAAVILPTSAVINGVDGDLLNLSCSGSTFGTFNNSSYGGANVDQWLNTACQNKNNCQVGILPSAISGGSLGPDPLPNIRKSFMSPYNCTSGFNMSKSKIPGWK